MKQFPTALAAAPSVAGTFSDLAASWPHDRIGLGDLMLALRERGFGILLIALAIPNFVPLPIPGPSAVFGIATAIFSMQLLMGCERPWLPNRLRKLSVARADFAGMIGRALPHLRRWERILHPRLPGLVSPLWERVVGLVCLMLSILIALPIPFTGIPLAVPIIAMALGIIGRDGLFIVGGLFAALASTVYALIVANTAIFAVLFATQSI
jgi:hypothetical protein